MTGKFIFLMLIVVVAFGEQYTLGSDEVDIQALTHLLNPLNGLFFDGPASISNAPTTKNENELPTLEQLQYYNYYAASMYYGYDHHDLSCEYCLKYRDDVCDNKVFTNDVHNTLALVTLSKKHVEIVVAFRGTWNVWNVVLDNLHISVRSSSSQKEIKIHQGYYIAVMSLYEDVVRGVACYLNENPGFKVVITGHSLGGAMARLMYFFLEENKQFPNIKYELYTYGEPRVGNKYFAEYMNCQPITTARVVNRADIFPHLPPTSILGTELLGDFYVHPHTEFWINGAENQNFCNRCVYEDPECSMSVGPVYSVADHLLYFDTNLGSVLGQPLIFGYLPLGVLNPVEVIPPLPKPIENVIGGFASELLSGYANG